MLSWKLEVPVDSRGHKRPAAATEVSTAPCHQAEYPPSLGGWKTTIQDVARTAQSKLTSLRHFATSRWSEGPRSSDLEEKYHQDLRTPGQCKQDPASSFVILWACGSTNCINVAHWMIGILWVITGLWFFHHLPSVLVRAWMGHSLAGMSYQWRQVQNARLKLCWRCHSLGALLEFPCSMPKFWPAEMLYYSGSWSCPPPSKLAQ